MNTPKVGEIWQHYRTKVKYRILLLSQNENDSTCLIVSYQNASDQTMPIWCRPMDEFIAYVDRDGITRFTLVKNEDLVSEAAERGFNS